jgi:enoyl-CoA hydratase/carnithine racemase
MMAAAATRVALELDQQGIARLRLCCADRRNAIDPAFVDELHEAVSAVQREPRVRVVLIHADGPAFSVGGDLQHFAAHRDELAEALGELVPVFHQALLVLASLPVPVVAAVAGAAAGGGLGIAWCSDVLIAADDALFATGYARLGLSGDGASSWWLPRLVGLRRAQQMLLQDRTVNAAEALEWGLVTEVVARDALPARAEAVAAELAAGPTGALGRMRRLLREGTTRDLGDQLAREAAEIIACGRTPEAREGVLSFTGRRAPDFVSHQQGDRVA